ncbi:hypothetical protein ACFYOD_36010 [Streptomyces sp. NPDC006703]|uniref:restriction endonuclease-related protein n=1 Tax=Streptomyces sp. NPDC006703 TaxID=3364759 RepID=UPI0036A596CE
MNSSVSSTAAPPNGDVRTVVADDYLTVELLCAGLARIVLDRQRAMDDSHAVEAPDPMAGMLPQAWRSAVARLWWIGHHQGVDWDPSDDDVFGLCRLPMGEWPLRLDLSEADLNHTLLDGDDLSEFAEQAAHLARVEDAEAELVENQVFDLLMATAQANGRTEEEIQRAYVTLRLMHIRTPVLSDLEALQWARRLPAPAANGEPYVKQLLRAAYRFQQAPDGATLETCGACGVPLPGVGTCRVLGCAGGAVRRRLDTVEGYWVQHRATRRFHHDPGLVETRLFDAIGDLSPHVRLEEYPGLDAWDGATYFPRPGSDQEECWLFDAKDCVSASLLGRTFTNDLRVRADRRFLVVANHRATPAYLADLKREMDGRVRGISVLDETAFLGRVVERSQTGAQR